MKRSLKYLMFLILLLSDAIYCSSDCLPSECACTQICDQECASLITGNNNVYGKNFYLGRNQAANLARRMMGVQEKIHRFGNECFYAVGTIAAEYVKTFSNKNGNYEAKNLSLWFSSTNDAKMSYGMNDNSGSNPNKFNLNALNWGYTGSGTIEFCPQKNDFIVDLNLYLGLDNIFCGLWARIDVPFVRTSWDINLIEEKAGDPSSVLPANLFNDNASDGSLENVYSTFKEALLGDKKVGSLPVLNYGKICVERSTSSVAPIRIDIGYDWFRRECWHFASSTNFYIPTGTKPTGEYLFEPLVGNGARFEAGSAINFAYKIWSNCDESHTFSFFLDAYVNTIIASNQKRILGLTPVNANLQQSTWSQYLLLKKYNNSNQVTGLERAANITTGNIKVGVSVEGALAALLQWNCNCLMAGIGYELWGRSHERARYRCFEIKENTYALQGVTDLYSGEDTTNSANAPKSTISTPGASTTFTTSSYLSNEDLLICAALHPSANTNKIFGFFGYNWNNCDWQPFVLIGGEAEFANSNSAFSQWGIIGKGGINF